MKKRGEISRRRGRYRVYAIPLAILAGLTASALPATAAGEQVLSYPVPEGTETVWIDIESPDVNLSNTGAETGYGSSWTDLALRDTAFGVSAILPVQSGQLQLRLQSTLASDADVSVSFAGAGNTLLRVSSQRIPLQAGVRPTPSPAPSETAPHDGGTAAPSGQPTSTASPTSTATPAPGDSSSATPVPSSSSVGAAPNNGTGTGNELGAGTTVKPQASDTSGLASTGWTPLLLFTALAVLAAGAVIAIAARKKGAHL